ncbi:MAG: serine/threonine-protein kinase [Bradymonadales bacterium]
MTSKENEIIANRYKILSCLGEGAMGVVYKAEHILMKKIVAIKILHAQVSQQSEIVARFQREAQAASSINHPNICSVTEFDYTAEGDFFLVMEYLEGETLRERLEALGALTPMQAISIAIQILSALHKAHELGIVHRDIKPDNIYLIEHNDDKSFVKILDFGIARNSAFDGDQRLTQTGMIYGTPQYLSPEQASGSEVGVKSDLYSVGIILFEMLAGQPPFVAENLVLLLHKHISEKPPLLKSACPKFATSTLFDAVIQKLLKKDPSERYESAAEVVSDLLDLADELAEPIPPAMLLAKILVDKQSVDTLTSVNAKSNSLKSIQSSQVSTVVTRLRKKRTQRLYNFAIILILLCILALVAYYFIKRPNALKITEQTKVQLYPASNDARLASLASRQALQLNTGYRISQDESMIQSRNIIVAMEYLFIESWKEARDALAAEYEIFYKNPNYLKLLIYALHKSENFSDSLEQMQQLLDRVPEAAQDKLIGEVLVDAIADDKYADAVVDFIKNNPTPWIGEGILLNIIDDDITKNNKYRQNIVDLLEEIDAYPALPQWLQLAVELRLNDTTACKKREDIINKLLELDEPRAWAAIEPFSRVGKRGCTNKLGMARDCQECIRPLIREARKRYASEDAEKADD